jgi:predicted phosphodiesterase
MKIGIVSDTHGLLRPEVAPALAVELSAFYIWAT